MTQKTDKTTHSVSLASRRTVLKGLGAGFVATFTAASGPAFANQEQQTLFRDRKVLLIYYSWGGVTREVSQQIQAHTKCDRIEVFPKTPYSTNDQACHDQAKDEQRRGARPEIVVDMPDLANYDLVLFGYPLWWYTLPMPLFTFLETYDFSQARVAPFCTHKGSFFANSLADFKAITPDVTFEEGLEIRGGTVGTVQTPMAREAILTWLQRLSEKEV